MYVHISLVICCVTKFVIDIECFPPGDPGPLLYISSNQSTVEGEDITFNCTFKGNCSPFLYTVYWEIAFQNGSNVRIQDDSNISNFHIDTKQRCPPTTCTYCCFTTTLKIHASMPLNSAMITCATLYGSRMKYTSNASNLSELQII